MYNIGIASLTHQCCQKNKLPRDCVIISLQVVTEKYHYKQHDETAYCLEELDQDEWKRWPVHRLLFEPAWLSSHRCNFYYLTIFSLIDLSCSIVSGAEAVEIAITPPPSIIAAERWKRKKKKKKRTQEEA